MSPHESKPSYDDSPPVPGFGPEETSSALPLIRLALAEDLGDRGDITTRALAQAGFIAQGSLVARADGVLAGMPVLALLAQHLGMGSAYLPLFGDGAHLRPGHIIARLAGPLAPILTFERTALNFLAHLSGIATLTSHFVAAVADTGAIILDTRKTLPGWRRLEKYAVLCGGGRNHREGLFDAVLIKDNHLAALGKHTTDPIGESVRLTRTANPPGTVVEIEVDSLPALDRALQVAPDIVLLDNFSLAELTAAVKRRDAVAPTILLEASGGVTLETVRSIAMCGVDRISAGALTHSAKALDLALDFDPPASETV